MTKLTVDTFRFTKDSSRAAVLSSEVRVIDLNWFSSQLQFNFICHVDAFVLNLNLQFTFYYSFEKCNSKNSIRFMSLV